MDLQQFLMSGGAHALGGAGIASNPSVTEFNAGMLTIKNGKAEPDHRRGRIIVDQTSSTRFRIKWVIRPSMTEDWSITANANDFEMVRVNECKDARVYRIKHKSDKSKDKYIWMQEVKESTDAEVVRKFNSAVAPNSRNSRSAAATASSSATASSAGAAGAASARSSLETPAVGTTARAPGNQREILRSLLSQASGASPNTAGRSNELQMELLRAAIAAQLQEGALGHKRLSLTDVFNSSRILGSLSDEAQTRLAQHLPEGEQNKSNVASHIRSAQFQTALRRFSGALEQAYQPVMGAIGVTPSGDDFGVAGFIDSIQREVDSSRPSAPADAANQSNDTNNQDANPANGESGDME